MKEKLATEAEVNNALQKFVGKGGIIEVQEPELDPPLNLMVGEKYSKYEILNQRWMYIID